jgi:hypothetical protein
MPETSNSLSPTEAEAPKAPSAKEFTAKLKGNRNSSNFEVWLSAVRGWLGDCDAWDPNTNSPVANTRSLYMFLHGTIATDNPNYSAFSNAKTGMEMWAQIMAHYRGISTVQHMGLAFQALATFEFSSDCVESVNRAQGISANLESAFGPTITPKDLVLVALLFKCSTKERESLMDKYKEKGGVKKSDFNDMLSELQLAQLTELASKGTTANANRVAPKKNKSKKPPHNGEQGHYFDAAKCWTCHPELKADESGSAKRVASEDANKGDLVLYPTFSCRCERFNPDSGTSDHMCQDIRNLNELVSINRRIYTANDNVMNAKQMGKFKAKSSSGMGLILDQVLAIPELSENLMSIARLARKGLSILFNENGVVITKQQFDIVPSDVVLSGPRIGNRFEVVVHHRNCQVTPPYRAMSTVTIPDENGEPIKLTRREFHERMNHLNHTDIDWLERNGKLDVELVPKTDTPKSDYECESCIMGKCKKGAHKPRNSPVHAFGQEFHMDILGPLPRTKEGYRYAAIATDKFSNMSYTVLASHKNHIYGWLEILEKNVYNQIGRFITHLRTDQEFTNNEVTSIANKYGTIIMPSTPYDHEQGGLRERMNLTYLDPVRAMLNASQLPSSYWGLALKCLQHTRNISPSSRLKDDGKVPYELAYRKPPNYGKLHIFW